MLQMINPNGQAILSGQDGNTLAAGFAQAHGAPGEAPTFDLLPAGELPAEGLAEPPVNAAVEQAPASEPDAEQWLLSMLDQQAVRVQARETPVPEAVALAALPATSPAGAEDVLPAVTPPLPEADVQAAPAFTARQVLPVVSGAAPLPSPAQGEAMVAPTLLPVASAEQVLERSLSERVASLVADGDAPAPAAASAAQPAAQPQAAERSLRLHAPQAQWGEQMLHSLREQVDLQINQRIQNATIRLDPPELGSLEIFLSHESGRLSVQLSAANADVARLLQHTSERLRQELVGQNFVQVNVQVSADAQGGRQHGQPRQAWPGEDPVRSASAAAESGARTSQDSASDVLVTV